MFPLFIFFTSICFFCIYSLFRFFRSILTLHVTFLLVFFFSFRNSSIFLLPYFCFILPPFLPCIYIFSLTLNLIFLFCSQAHYKNSQASNTWTGVKCHYRKCIRKHRITCWLTVLVLIGPRKVSRRKKIIARLLTTNPSAAFTAEEEMYRIRAEFSQADLFYYTSACGSKQTY